MLEQTWRTVRRLLLLSFFNPAQARSQLNGVVPILRQALPETAIALLTPDANNQMTFGLFAIEVASVSQEQTEISLTSIFTSESLRKTIALIKARTFDAAIILTDSSQSPYALAYLCYLAGIPIRVGQSREFGGSVLSACISPPLENVSSQAYHLHLLKSIGLPIPVARNLA